MAFSKIKTDDPPKPIDPVSLAELDRVRLTRAVTDKGRSLATGLQGTVVLCHGNEAYEVEFDTITDDFFQVLAGDLAKI